MQPAGPFTLALNESVTVAPTGTVNDWSTVVLANSSPFACKVTSEAGPQPWLQAWSSQAYDISATNETLTVTPLLATNPGAPSGVLTADYYQPVDGQPDGYPQPLTAPNAAALIATLTFTNNDPPPQPVAVPAWASCLELHAITPGIGAQLSVNGRTSGIEYFNSNQGFGLLQFPVKVDIPVSVESVVDVGMSGLGSASCTIYVVARDDLSGLNATSQPLIIDTLNFGWTGATAVIAPSGTGTLLATPPAGYAYKIGTVSLGFRGPVTAASLASVHGHTTGVPLLTIGGPTGSMAFDNLDAGGIIVGEAIEATNSGTGANIGASIWATAVLLYYNNSV